MSRPAHYDVIEDARISEESSNTYFSAKRILFQDNERDERPDARWLTTMIGDEESYFVVDLLEPTQLLGVNFRQGSNGNYLTAQRTSNWNSQTMEKRGLKCMDQG